MNYIFVDTPARICTHALHAKRGCLYMQIYECLVSDEVYCRIVFLHTNIHFTYEDYSISIQFHL